MSGIPLLSHGQNHVLFSPDSGPVAPEVCLTGPALWFKTLRLVMKAAYAAVWLFYICVLKTLKLTSFPNNYFPPPHSLFKNQLPRINVLSFCCKALIEAGRIALNSIHLLMWKTTGSVPCV